MKHPEEHILELYVLNAASVADRAGEIEEHLRTCAGCKALVGEISGFYSELDAELRNKDNKAAESIGHALSKRNPDLAVWEERLARGRWGGWSSPVKNLRYYIRRYPIASAGATFAFAALAGIGLLMGYRDLMDDRNPWYVTLNQQSGFFEVYNRQNELLWKRLLPNATVAIDDQTRTELTRYAVTDLDGDGGREVLTPLFLRGEPELRTNGLHVFDGGGKHVDFDFERKVSFRGNPYEMPVRIENGSLIVVDTAGPTGPEIFLTVKNDRSPIAILRMNAGGEVLGEYWHQGHIVGLYLHDVDGDGSRELVACGINDADDNVRLSDPVIIILDPRKIEGRLESQLTPGYGHTKSGAEEYYLRLPLTELNVKNEVGALVGRFRVHEDRFVFLWGFQTPDGLRYDLDFVFSRSFEPLRVVPPTQIKQLFDREFAAKRVSTLLDGPYLEYLRSQVRFWDGKEWRPEPVRVAPSSTVSAAR